MILFYNTGNFDNQETYPMVNRDNPYPMVNNGNTTTRHNRDFLW